MLDKVLSTLPVLNIPGFGIIAQDSKYVARSECCSEFWIYQGSKYASGFEYARILNILEL